MGASRTISLVLVLSICLNGAVWAAPPSVCDLAKKRGGLTMYAVDVNPDQNGNREITADIDGDGSTDKINPGSGSIIPADNSTVTVTLSSNGKTFTVEEG